MAPWKPSGAGVALSDIGPDTMIYEGEPISLATEVGALTLLHGALQSAIGSVDDACAVEAAYQHAVILLSSTDDEPMFGLSHRAPEIAFRMLSPRQAHRFFVHIVNDE